VCQRDKSSSYWNSSTLSSYSSQCVPDVKTQGLQCATIQGILANKNLCNPTNLHPSYANMQCCYDDSSS
jgi:hypothetical protein